MGDKHYDLFLSYSRYSLDTAERIERELEKYGLLVWLDRTDVILGSEIYTNLSDVLTKAKEWLGVMLLLDKTYFSKEWCIRELDLSIQNKLHIYPILNKMEKNDIPEKYSFLKSYNMVTLRGEKDMEYVINKILDALLQEYHLSEININTSTIYDKLVLAYYNQTRADIEKVICADNLMRYLECSSSQAHKLLNCFLAKIIHNKCCKLFSTGELNSFDIKIVCHAADIVIDKIKQNE